MLQLSKTMLAAGLGIAINIVMSTGAHAADEVTGAGSTFVYPILSKWSADYSQKTDVHVIYQSIGSGGGIAQIKAATVDFGASDMPMKAEELASLGMGQFPSVIGGVVPVMNLKGIEPGTVKFDGPLMADIFLGKITQWNDPAITKLNPGVKLPDANITVVHRSDGSGTTFNWVNYLSKVSPEWKSKVGEGVSVAWPVGLAGSGNEGIVTYVKQVPNSIGYVEYAYVKQNKLNFGLLQNKAGKFVVPNAQSFQAAASTADWTNAKDFDLVMTDAPGDNAYPVTATTFIIMYKQPKDAERSKIVHDFFRWSLENGQAQANSLDYVALPAPLVKQIESYWAENFK
jgi:phosphate transport system substrate-binding protein